MSSLRPLNRAKQIKKLKLWLDKNFSVYIRERDQRLYGHCFFCSRPIEHNFHFIPRGKWATRFDPDNCVASCSFDNFKYNRYPTEYINKYIHVFGADRFNLINERSKQTVNKSLEWLTEKEVEVKALLSSLKDGVNETLTYGKKA